MATVAVVGAGVVGLSSAINIQRMRPDARVRIIADQFAKDTTSDGAGGLFRVTTKYTPGVPEAELRKWSTNSWDHLAKIALSKDAGEVGVMVVSGYVLSDVPLQKQLYQDIVFNCSEMTPGDLRKLNFDSKYKYGLRVTTLITEVRKYMPWLMKQFRENGGEVEFRTLKSLDELVGQYDVVVNCSGMRSQTLVGDKTIYPVRGQLLRVRAPWIQHFIFTEHGAFVIPNGEYVVLGGTREKDNYSTEVEPSTTRGILERCRTVWPAMEGAKIEREWAGLRPSRTPVRLEIENMRLPSGTLKVVHNYGHGSNGIALSWGTGIVAAEKVKDILARTVQSRL